MLIHPTVGTHSRRRRPSLQGGVCPPAQALTRLAGTTLIEMLIGLVIVAMLVGMALPSFMIWIQNTQIRTATEALLSGLQISRAEAVRRNEQITFTLAGFDWAITDSTGATIETHSATEGSLNAVITVQGAMPLTFNGMGRPSGAALAAVANNDVTILSISNPTGGACQTSGSMRCLEVHVTLGGQVRMCDPVLPTTNPQAC